MVELLAGAGFEVAARLEKAPEPDTAAGRVRPGFVVARKPVAGERGPGA